MTRHDMNRLIYLLAEEVEASVQSEGVYFGGDAEREEWQKLLKEWEWCADGKKSLNLEE